MAKQLTSGDILCFPLWHGWGFAYAKYINIIGLNGNNSYPDLLKIFDYRSPVAEPLPLTKLQSYLLQPMLLAGRYPTLRQGLWSIVGHLPLVPEDAELPELRLPDHLTADRLLIRHPLRPGAGFYLRNLSLHPPVETARANVAHLEYLPPLGSGLVEISTTMAFMRQEGVDPRHCFDLSIPYEQQRYEQMRSRPLANTLPPYLYGRACQPGQPEYVSLP